MASNKVFYWLRLKASFFNDKKIKKMLKQDNGYSIVVIYIKMMLKSLENEGQLFYEGIEESIADEIALDIDEPAETVEKAITFLTHVKLLEIIEKEGVFLPQVQDCIGKETNKAKSMRDLREKRKQEPDKKSNNVTDNGNSVTNDGNNVTDNGNNVLPCNDAVTKCYPEKRRNRVDIELQLEKELQTEKQKENSIVEVEPAPADFPTYFQNATVNNLFYKFLKNIREPIKGNIENDTGVNCLVTKLEGSPDNEKIFILNRAIEKEDPFLSL